jgi:hypothetical protein
LDVGAFGGELAFVHLLLPSFAAAGLFFSDRLEGGKGAMVEEVAPEQLRIRMDFLRLAPPYKIASRDSRHIARGIAGICNSSAQLKGE